MKDYSKGKIYTIRSATNNRIIYIGSTTKTLQERFKNGKHECIPYYDNANYYYIELYMDYPCNSEEELRKKEGEIIDLYKKDGNYLVLNKRKEHGRNNEDRMSKICECGCKYTPHSEKHIQRHLQSQKHLLYLQNKNINNM